MLTMLDERTNLAQQVMAELKSILGKSSARRRSRATSGWRRRRAMGSRRLIYDLRSKGAESYIRLAKEIIGRHLAAAAAPAAISA